jgi:hypothetical protein
VVRSRPRRLCDGDGRPVRGSPERGRGRRPDPLPATRPPQTPATGRPPDRSVTLDHCRFGPAVTGQLKVDVRERPRQHSGTARSDRGRALRARARATQRPQRPAVPQQRRGLVCPRSGPNGNPLDALLQASPARRQRLRPARIRQEAAPRTWSVLGVQCFPQRPGLAISSTRSAPTVCVTMAREVSKKRWRQVVAKGGDPAVR